VNDNAPNNSNNASNGIGHATSSVPQIQAVAQATHSGTGSEESPLSPGLHPSGQTNSSSSSSNAAFNPSTPPLHAGLGGYASVHASPMPTVFYLAKHTAKEEYPVRWTESLLC
jgi:hypothetical protein